MSSTPQINRTNGSIAPSSTTTAAPRRSIITLNRGGTQVAPQAATPVVQSAHLAPNHRALNIRATANAATESLHELAGRMQAYPRDMLTENSSKRFLVLLGKSTELG